MTNRSEKGRRGFQLPQPDESVDRPVAVLIIVSVVLIAMFRFAIDGVCHGLAQAGDAAAKAWRAAAAKAPRLLTPMRTNSRR